MLTIYTNFDQSGVHRALGFPARGRNDPCSASRENRVATRPFGPANRFLAPDDERGYVNCVLRRNHIKRPEPTPNADLRLVQLTMIELKLRYL